MKICLLAICLLFIGCSCHTDRSGIDAILHSQEAYRIYIETEVNAGRMTYEAGYVHLSNGMMATEAQLMILSTRGKNE